MDGRRLAIGDTIRFGWEKTTSNFGPLIVIVIVGGLASGLPSWIANVVDQPLSGLLRLIGFIIQMVISIGATRIGLKLHDGQPVSIGDLFAADWSVFWRYTVATILYVLGVIIGLILFIVPGVIVAVRYSLYAFFVVDRGARPVEALTQSAAATEGVRWDVFLLLVALVLLLILGAVALLVGLFLTAPLFYIALARAYRTLTGAPPSRPMQAGVVTG